jgi:hypothetical protein
MRPDPLAALAVSGAAAAVWLVVSLYGAFTVDLLWGAAACVAGIAVLVLTLRAFPVLALLPALLGVVSWGLVTRAWLPDSFGDVLGVLRFVAANLLFAVPLLASYMSAVDFDARREARRRLGALPDRRWWGEPDADVASLRALEAIPATRFFALDGDGPATALVLAGRHAAILYSTVWPDGDYQMSGRGEVMRGGRPYPPGTEDVDVLADRLRGWVDRLAGTGATCKGFLVVHAPRDGHSEDVYLNIAPGERLHIVNAAQVVDVVGGYLSAEPYRIDVYVLERLLTKLGYMDAGA